MTVVDPKRFDEFIIDSMLGEGGMGKVYRARQTALDRWVALKVLPRAKENKNFIERFYREARSAARLVHPNIVQIHTVGELEGVPYFTMEYVEGVDLEHLVHDRMHVLGRDEIVEIARCVVKALAVASEQGIVHRDIKPANVMISKTGLIKVMDFGLAKELDHNITQSGVVVGTPTYMSPEQGSGQTVDFRSDLYSLGCVLYEMVKGTPPFVADKVAAVIYKHMFEQPVALNSPDSPCDQQVEEFIMKLLKKKPEDRYQTPDETLECLAQIYCNHAAAELALSRHAQRHLKARKARDAEMSLSRDVDAPKVMIQQRGGAAHRPKSEVKPETVEHKVEEHKTEEKTPEVPQKAPEKAEPKEVIEAPQEPAASLDTIPAPDGPGNAAPPIVQTQRVKFLRVQKPNRPNTPDPGESAEAIPVQPLPPIPSLQPIPTPTSPIPHMPVAKQETKKYGGAALAEAQKAMKGTNAPPAVPPKPLNMLKPPPKKEKSGHIEPGKRPPSIHTQRPSSIITDAEVITRETKPVVMRIIDRPKAVSPVFTKLQDGRWSYVTSPAHCVRAEGLAQALDPVPAPSGSPRSLGDCLLCPNWNEKRGCALACNDELLADPRHQGLKLLSEMAANWIGAGRFDRAIALLNDFVEDNPDNPDGYRELARIYDSADYKGRDKRRGIIMYLRFIDLARASGTYSQIEISRAEARANALKTGPATSGTLAPGEAIEFDCFYRGASECYIFGRADAESLVAVKIGYVDPHTGNSEPDPSAGTSTFRKAVSMFSRSKTDQEKQEEQTAVRKELARLCDLDLNHVRKESNIACALNFDAVTSFEPRAMPPDLTIVRLKEKSTTHSFIFTARNAYEGQQLKELLTRRLARKKKL